jgi:hypothetical protein
MRHVVLISLEYALLASNRFMLMTIDRGREMDKVDHGESAKVVGKLWIWVEMTLFGGEISSNF